MAQGSCLACSSVLLFSSNSHLGVVHRIESALYAKPNPPPKLLHLGTENIKQKDLQVAANQACLIVTIGSEALAEILKTQTKTPILSILIRKHMFNHLLQENNRHQNDSYPITAIFLDQPIERQLNLLQCLLPLQPDKHLGVLLGPNSLEEQEFLQQETLHRNIKLTTIFVNKNENPVGVLDALIDEANVVLAIPDKRIYNPKTARGILLSAFHKRVSLIGYSKTFVNNGALAAVYSTSKQIAEQSAEQICTILHQKTLNPPQYPKEFTLAVNYQVARSLGLEIENEAELKIAMDKMEKIGTSRDK